MIEWPKHLKAVADQTMSKTKSAQWFSRYMKDLAEKEDQEWMQQYRLNFAKIYYILKNNLEDIPKCRECGSYDINFHKGSWHCSAKCAANDEETRKKAKTTCIEYYGVDNPNKSKDVQEKARKTCMERYGVSNASQSNDIQNKIKQTNLEKYGVENPFASDEVKSKIRQTNLKKYGVEWSFQAEEVKEKIKKTNLRKYGVENIQQQNEVKEKTKQTNLERYGFENPMQNEDVKNKVKQTNLERYGVEYVMQNEKVRERSRQTNLERYGVIYPLQNEDIKRKVKQTNLERYGVEYVTQNENIKKLIVQTNLKKYGVEWTMQNEDVKNKARQTNLERYGVEYVTQSNEIIAKIKTNYMEHHGVDWVSKDEAVKQKKIEMSRKKYGVDCHLQLEAIKQKIAQTNFERYGNVCSLHGEKVHEKVESIMLKRYGYKNASQSFEIRQKMSRSNRMNWREWNIARLLENHIEVLADEEEYISSGEIRCKCLLCGNDFLTEGRNYHNITCPNCISGKEGIVWSKPEKEIAAFIKKCIPNIEVLENVRNVISPQELDIYIPELNVAIEFNGMYWHSDAFKDELYHLNKSLKCATKGIHLIHVFEWEWDMHRNGIENLLLKEFNECIEGDDFFIGSASYEECAEFIKMYGVIDAPKKLSCIKKLISNDIIVGIAGWVENCLECLCFDWSKKVSIELIKTLLQSFPGDSFTYCCDLAKESVDLLCKLGFVIKNHWPPKSIWIKGNMMEISDKKKDGSWYRIYDCGLVEMQWNR